MENTKEIKLVQKPVIEHALSEIGASVTARIEALNVDKLVATSETVKSLKSLRADLSKELNGYELQRKEIKSAVASPYQEFEATYKLEVSEKFKGAIDVLKGKISAFEIQVKQARKDDLVSYFTELCLDAEIDFLEFANTGIEVNLSTSTKKYKEQLAAFVQKTQDDVMLIKSTEYEAEIMTEYKKTLNSSKAITEVRTRKENERLEKERIKQAETDRRVAMLLKLAMVSNQMTQTYVYVSNDSIYIEINDVENLSKEDFQTRYVAIERAIKSDKESKAPKVETKSLESVAPKNEPKKPAAPLKSPTVVKETAPATVKTFIAKFECEGTMAQLKALGAYMKENNITYKNI